MNGDQIRGYVKQERLKRKMTRRVFADLIGTNATTLARFENGIINCNFLLVFKMMECLDMEVNITLKN